MTPSPERPPPWFERALAEPFTDEQVTVDGADIHYLAWGQPGRRGLVFVHGGGAHAHWWTHVAARFARQYRVLAIDLSGHGDSGRRQDYELEGWAREVVAVAGHGGIEGPPVIIGHSMGGFVTIVTASRFGGQLAGVVVCDSPVTAPDPELTSYQHRAFGGGRVYETLDAAVARFRPVPEQQHYLDYVVAHVARRSVRQVEGGWTWKFDQRVFEQFTRSMRSVALPYLARVRCRFALLRAENGLVTPDIADFMYEVQGRVAPVVELPEAGHHMMLDQPLVLLTALRALLADWDHSLPRHPPVGDRTPPGAR